MANIKHRDPDDVTSLSWGLFAGGFSKLRNIRRNLKDIPILIGRVLFAIRHGYFPQGQWQTDEYLIYMLYDILSFYRSEGSSYPDRLDSVGEWYEILDEMLACLTVMKQNEDDCDDWDELEDKRIEAKDRFFKLFSEYFFDLWD